MQESTEQFLAGRRNERVCWGIASAHTVNNNTPLCHEGVIASILLRVSSQVRIEASLVIHLRNKIVPTLRLSGLYANLLARR